MDFLAWASINKHVKLLPACLFFAGALVFVSLPSQAAGSLTLPCGALAWVQPP